MNSKICYVLLIIFYVISVNIFAENVTFSSPQTISLDGFVPQITTDSLGKNVYTMFVDGVGNVEIYFSANWGNTWSAATGTFGAGSTGPIVTSFSGQYVYAIWSKNPGNTIKIFRSSNFGATWTDLDPTDSLYGNGTQSQIIIDASGKLIYAIWASTVGFNIKIFRSSDFGASWTDVDPGSTFGAGIKPQIASDYIGEDIYATWRENGTNDIKIYQSHDFGNTWSAATGSFGKGLEQEKMTSSDGQHVYAIWPRISDNAFKIFRSSNFGATWTDVDPTDSLFGTGTDPEITTSADGKYVYVILDASDGIRIYYSQNFGVDWTFAGNFGDGAGPFIKTDSSGRYIYAIWRENGTDNNKLFYSIDFGSTWINADPTNTFQTGFEPMIAIDSIGRNIYGIWDSTGVSRIDLTRGLRSFFPVNSLSIQK